MMQLVHLNEELARLRRYRQSVRYATAAASVAIAVLVVLAAIFALDWYFQRNEDVWQRLFLLAAGIAALAWATYRYAASWLKQREDQLEMALLVQRHAGIDSDLVAALQFESPEAAQWGSSQLTAAVIEKVSVRQKDLDVMASIEAAPLKKRLKLLAGACAVWLVLGIACPGHVRVFLSRLFLGSQHYPTQTHITAVAVNGRRVDFASPHQAAVTVPYGRPVTFEVETTGVRPSEGRVELLGQGKDAVVKLSSSTDTGYKGQHARLIETARYQVFVGDAWTDPLPLNVMQPPNIVIEPEVIPPAYARKEGEDLQRLPLGTGQFAVIEGSEVHLKIHSDRALKSVTLTALEKPIPMVLQKGEATTDKGQVWASQSADTPLAAVTEPMRFTVQVTDDEDQGLEQPLEGFIRIKPDLPPRIVAATRTPFVLPDAQPTIYFGATDDHAISRVWLTTEVVREGEPAKEAATQEETEVFKATAEPQARHEGTYALSLSPLHLVAGDTLKVTLHTSDFRGPRKGKSTDSEPLVFHVTTEQGVISSLLEGDQKSARELEGAIKRLLDIGDAP